MDARAVLVDDDIVPQVEPGGRANAQHAVTAIVSDGVEEDVARRAQVEQDTSDAVADQVACDGNRVRAIGDIDAVGVRPGHGEAVQLGTDHAVERHRCPAESRTIDNRRVGSAAQQPHVARHADRLVVGSTAHADDKLEGAQAARPGTAVERRQRRLSGVQGVLNLAEGVYAPLQPIVETCSAVAVVGEVGRLAALDVADVHPPSARRRRVVRVARVKQRRAVQRAEVVLRQAGEQRILGQLARPGLVDESPINAVVMVLVVAKEVVVAVQFSARRAGLEVHPNDGVEGEDAVAHIHGRAIGCLEARPVAHNGIVDYFNRRRRAVEVEARLARVAHDGSSQLERGSAVLRQEAVEGLAPAVEGDTAQCGALDALRRH